MAPPPPQESFTFTVGKLGEVSNQRNHISSLILLMLDAGMAVGPQVLRNIRRTEPCAFRTFRSYWANVPTSSNFRRCCCLPVWPLDQSSTLLSIRTTPKRRSEMMNFGRCRIKYWKLLASVPQNRQSWRCVRFPPTCTFLHR